MVKPDLSRFVDRQRVREAILRAEAETTAPITVQISPHVEGDVHAAALRSLHRRGLSRKRERNAVHFFVVPSRREFAIVGDAGAHERLGQAAWNDVAATVERHFRAGDPTGGLVAGIEEVGQHLARHFPRTAAT
ncbi:MAG TPA: TPM domain-containing protein [Candidatus Elarobacter sp.]|nr:TPM domain-containing protein [Candidatus Elarobacter sp.]